MENWLWKKLGTCYAIDDRMNKRMNVCMNECLDESSASVTEVQVNTVR